jgi:hypothetical protein
MKQTTLTFVCFVVLAFIKFSACILRYTLDEEYKVCSTGERYVDFSNFHVIIINETASIGNGSVVILKEINRPWRFGFEAEKLIRGKWSKMVQKHIVDFCTDAFNPVEMYEN